MKMIEAAKEALKSLNRQARAREIYEEIVRRELYKFGAKDPASVLSGTMRQRTEGSRSLRGQPLFRSPERGLFELIVPDSQ